MAVLAPLCYNQNKKGRGRDHPQTTLPQLVHSTVITLESLWNTCQVCSPPPLAYLHFPPNLYSSWVLQQPHPALWNARETSLDLGSLVDMENLFSGLRPLEWAAGLVLSFFGTK